MNCTLLLPFFFATALLADPDIFIARPVHDFGEEKNTQTVVHAFKLENRGGRTLKIYDVKTSCGCTTSGDRSLSIDPGESETLEIQMDLRGRSGPQVQHITLKTNDPDDTTVSLKLTGIAVPQIRVSPRTLNLELSDPDALHSGVVVLSSTTGEPFTVTSAKGNRNRIKVEVAHSDDRKRAEITVKPRPQDGQGRFTDVLLIETDHPEVKEVRVLVMWQISNGISVAPGQVNLVLSDEGKPVDRYVMVRGYPGLKPPLEVTRVEWPGQEVEITATDTGKLGWRVHLRQFVPTREMKDSKLIIHTNAQGFRALEVPVRLLEN